MPYLFVTIAKENKQMTTATNYKGRVWTCSTHDEQIVDALLLGSKELADKILKSVHPKNGGDCKDCAYYYELTPSINR
jgi:hypothetical protein